MTPFNETAVETLADVMRDRQRGYSLVESLERNGMLSPGDEFSSKPWEIDEERDEGSLLGLMGG